MDMSQGAFTKKVDLCRKNLSNELIDNAAWDHAIYLFQNLLEVAAEKKERVRIVSGTLNKAFYNSLTSALDKCINADVQIDVIIQDKATDLSDNIFVQKIKDYGKGSVYTLKEGDVIPHMLLIGDKGQRFRLEIDHSQTKAVASFNNFAMGALLVGMYEGVKGRLEPYQLPIAA